MEEMVEAIVALADCDFTGRTCVSLDLIAELGLTVHALDGASLSLRRTGAISNTGRCPSRCLRSGQVPGERIRTLTVLSDLAGLSHTQTVRRVLRSVAE